MFEVLWYLISLWFIYFYFLFYKWTCKKHINVERFERNNGTIQSHHAFYWDTVLLV